MILMELWKLQRQKKLHSIYNELEPEDTKNLIIETKLYSGYSQAEYFDVDDFEEELEL